MNMQLEKVKEIARQQGGDVIILTESGSGVSYSPGTGEASSYEIRTFEISKKVIDKKES